MKFNEKDVPLEGDRVILVPYTKDLVRKYHSWMQDPYIQQMTASEPLSLEQEFLNQISWTEDPSKCTFIILSKEKYKKNHSKIDAMVGDINLFLSVDQDERKIGELNVMIGESEARSKGYAFESINILTNFAVRKLSIQRAIAKISVDNTQSLSLFRKLQFIQFSQEPNVFGELEFFKDL